ncbi:MAG TPA: DUF2231 domain-containing protein, partial [Rhodothermales bacterium]
PDWAPGLHPLVVHFPIALLVSALIVDVFSLLQRGRGMAASTWLYVAGAATLAIAFLTGRAGADAVMVPPEAERILTDHENWALRTLIFFSVLAIMRLVVLMIRRLRNMAINGVLALLGLAGVGLLTITADRGGNLVYGFGVGVTLDEPETVTADAGIRADTVALVGPEGFSWTPGRLSATKLRSEFDDFGTNMSDQVIDVQADSLLVVRADESAVIVVTKEPFQSVQIEMDVNLNHLKGVFDVVFGATSIDGFDALRLDSTAISLGRLEAGGFSTMDRTAVDGGGWMTLGAVSDDGHFRGYLDRRLVVHGHGKAGASGGVGFRLQGEGLVLIRSMRVTPLR